jgi:hypothetical protein
LGKFFIPVNHLTNKVFMKFKMISAAVFLAMSAPAMAVVCTGDNTNLGAATSTPISFASQCFRTFSPAGNAFTDHYSFSTTTLGSVAGNLVNFLIFNFNDVNLGSVSLSGAGFNGLDSNLTDGFSFAGLSAGSYNLSVTGSLSRGQFFGGYTGSIASIAAPVPEPETYAMMLIGLAGVGLVARRRNKNKANS